MSILFLNEDNGKFPFDLNRRKILFHEKLQHVYKHFKLKNNIDLI